MWVYGKTEPGWYVAAIHWDAAISKQWKDKGYAVEVVDWPKMGRTIPPSYVPRYDS